VTGSAIGQSLQYAGTVTHSPKKRSETKMTFDLRSDNCANNDIYDWIIQVKQYVCKSLVFHS
jgi:hypothetical protein